jgi:hypothetical protein
LGRIWKEAVIVCFKEMFQNLFRGTEKDHKVYIIVDILLAEGWTRTFQVWGRVAKHSTRILSRFWLKFISTHCICLHDMVLRHLQVSNLTKTVIWFL